MKIFIFSIILLSFPTFSKNSSEDVEVKKSEFVDFKKIKQVLKSDMLSNEAIKKQRRIKKLKGNKLKREMSFYNYPSEDSFWTFISELWLVKNASILKWDYQKPHYGIEQAYTKLLEKLGIYERSFKIILIDSPNITHFALPSNRNEDLFILSGQFIKAMDLTKLEIALLLFEDYERAKQRTFINHVSNKKINSLLGSNFYKEKKVDGKLFEDILKKYDSMIFERGFNFQEQYTVTKKVDKILKNDLRVWQSYLKLIQKKDDLVKTNVLYQNYTKIYPSPELQLGWLAPKKNK